MVEALAGFLRALVVAPGPLVVGVSEPSGAGLPVDPAVGATQIEHLPRLQGDVLSGIHAPNLVALPEPPDDPVGPGDIEYIGEIACVLALQVVQMTLAGQDLILAALVIEAALGHLLGVDRHRMMQTALPSSRQRDHRPDPP